MEQDEQGSATHAIRKKEAETRKKQREDGHERTNHPPVYPIEAEPETKAAKDALSSKGKWKKSPKWMPMKGSQKKKFRMTMGDEDQLDGARNSPALYPF